jgi:hypothetical protein
VTPGKPVWVVLVGAACSLLSARTPAAQTTGTVDLGVSTVRYDGFLASGAASLTPAVRWQGPRAMVSARGTYLRFESGHRSLQGLVIGSIFTPATSRWRGELAASAGASSYADFASFWHAIAEARLHFFDDNRGAWIGGTGGRTSYGGPGRPVAAAAIGAWVRHREITLLGSASRTFVGDTAYTDLGSSVDARRGSIELEADLGARVWSHGGGRGVYGEANATVTLGERTALVVAVGRYPTDPIRGSIAGRYLGVALRIRRAPLRSVAARDPWAPRAREADGASSPTTARLEIMPDTGGVTRLIVHVPGATLVELAGDFTDWQPVVLSPTPDGSWEAALRIASGVHRMDVRIDGAGWIVPAGTTRVVDDFNGEVGLFAIP